MLVSWLALKLSFSTSKDTIKKEEAKAQWEKIFETYSIDKESQNLLRI